MTAEPRPEVVEELRTMYAEALAGMLPAGEFADRHSWSTGAERAAALAEISRWMLAEAAVYRSVADQQDAELRGREQAVGLSAGPPPDRQWLHDTGIAP